MSDIYDETIKAAQQNVYIIKCTNQTLASHSRHSRDGITSQLLLLLKFDKTKTYGRASVNVTVFELLVQTENSIPKTRIMKLFVFTCCFCFSSF